MNTDYWNKFYSDVMNTTHKLINKVKSSMSKEKTKDL